MLVLALVAGLGFGVGAVGVKTIGKTVGVTTGKVVAGAARGIGHVGKKVGQAVAR